jgi:Flp pilus assembly pilin Flp
LAENLLRKSLKKQIAREEKSNMERIKKFFNDETGASSPENALLVALIAVTIMSALGTLGGNIKAIFPNQSK